METFGRGCLYSIIVIIVLFFLALLAGGNITLPFFIAIPLFAIPWWLAYKKTKEKEDE